MTSQMSAMEETAYELEQVLLAHDSLLNADFEHALERAQFIWTERTFQTAMERMRIGRKEHGVSFVLTDILHRPEHYGEVLRQGIWPFQNTMPARSELKKIYERMEGSKRVWTRDIEKLSRELVASVRQQKTVDKAA